LTVSIPAEVADRLRSSVVYRRMVRPALTRPHRDPNVAKPIMTPVTPLNAEARALRARIGEVDWYHSIDLGQGVVTPGLVDYRAQLPFYGLPDSLAGKRVLDFATFDGFWAFEFERRGAEVFALDVASWNNVDMPDRRHPRLELDDDTGAGFALAHEILDSRVRRIEASVYDLDPDKIGMFDLVFMSDLLVHLRCPQRAIENAASVCRGELVIGDVFTPMLEGFGDLPLAQYAAPSHIWWLPNVRTLLRMMSIAGCEAIEEVSHFVLDGEVDGPAHRVVLRGRVTTDPLWLSEYRKWAENTSPKWKTAAEQPA